MLIAIAITFRQPKRSVSPSLYNQHQVCTMSICVLWPAWSNHGQLWRKETLGVSSRSDPIKEVKPPKILRRSSYARESKFGHSLPSPIGIIRNFQNFRDQISSGCCRVHRAPVSPLTWMTYSHLRSSSQTTGLVFVDRLTRLRRDLIPWQEAPSERKFRI